MKKLVRRAGPPHNPGLRDLIGDKRKWSSTSPQALGQRGFGGWNERGYLPHRDEPGLIQFVTFHLADSFPEELRSEWAAVLKIDDVLERRERLQEYLDRGRGECILRQSEVAKTVEGSLKFYQGQHYDLRAWAILPNHVHVLFKVCDVSMSRIVEDWKKFTAHSINKQLRRTGKLWAEDYWDTYMRDEEHELRTRQYIEANPVKAFLVRDARDWMWGSARLRDNYGRLCF